MAPFGAIIDVDGTSGLVEISTDGIPPSIRTVFKDVWEP